MNYINTETQNKYTNWFWVLTTTLKPETRKKNGASVLT